MLEMLEMKKGCELQLGIEKQMYNNIMHYYVPTNAKVGNLRIKLSGNMNILRP